MSSRERMLASINRRGPDVTPCSFMLFNALKSTCATYEEFVQRQMAMGLDALVQLPARPPIISNDYYNLYGLPVSYDPRVGIREWVERPVDESRPVLIKEYHTPAGILRAEVRQTADWPWGDHVPFLDDYIVPRSRRFLVQDATDLDSLRFLLVAPTAEEIAAFHTQATNMIALARRNGLLVAGGWGVGADLIGWIHGLQNMVFTVYDDAQFLAELLDIIAVWNRRRMEVVLDAGVDLYIKRAWYENCDFWTPSTWRSFILPILKEDVNLAHTKGARFGYIITSACMPLLDMLADCGVDVLIGVDPGEWDLAETQRTLAGRVCLWGGVSGHLIVEQGTPEDVRAEVARAMRVLAPTKGFILSPVDNVREDTARARKNTRVLIQEWQRLTKQG